MKYRNENYEPRRSKTGLTRGAFGQPASLRNVIIEEVRHKQPKPKRPIQLYKIDVNRLRTSKYSPNASKLDTKA